jgi:hypothetical protein
MRVQQRIFIGATCKIHGGGKKRQGTTSVVPKDDQNDIGL